MKPSLPSRRGGAVWLLPVLSLLAFLLVQSWTSSAAAYPWMIKHGYTGCGACHADPSGGELLTQYGRVMSASFLSTRWGGASESEEVEGKFHEPFFGAFPVPETLLVGGSFRFANLYRPESDGDKYRAFPMQIDLYGDLRIAERFHVGGSVGLARVPEGSPHARAAQVTSDQGDGLNLISRQHYVGYDFGEGAYTLRVGRLNLPFGLRMSEHVMWVREQTLTDRESDQQHGAALAMGFESLRFELMGIAGNYQVKPDRYRERGYSGYVEYFPTTQSAVGLSSKITSAADDRLAPDGKRTTRQAHGVMGRVALGELAVASAEADVILRRRKVGYVGFAQLDFEVIRGLHGIATGEVLDIGYREESGDPKRPGAGKPKLGGWLSAQWFFLAHFDARLDAIFRKDEPFQLLGQLHLYL